MTNATELKIAAEPATVLKPAVISKANAETIVRTTANLEALPLAQLRNIGKALRLRGYNGEHTAASLAAALKSKVKGSAPAAKSAPVPINAEAVKRNEMRDRALAAYKPQAANLADADKRLVAAIPAAIAAQTQVDVVSTAALAINIRDVVHFLMSADAGKDRVAPDDKAWSRIFTHIRKAANATEAVTEKTGNVERIIERRMLWEGVARSTWSYAIRAALLIWASDTTGVTVGRLDKLPGNKLIAEVEWLKEGKVAGICAPYNVIRPFRYRDIAGAANKDGHYLGADPVPVTETTLRWLNNAQINALHDHHFAGVDLHYDDRVQQPSAVPTGILARGLPPKRAGTDAAGGTGATTLETVTDKLASDDPTALLLAAAIMIRDKPTKDWNAKDRNQFLAAALAVGRMAAEWCDRNNVTASAAFCGSKAGTELADLYRTVNRVCTMTGETVMTVIDGRPSRALDATNKSILPDKPAAVKRSAAA